MARILMVASEGLPFIKSGGLVKNLLSEYLNETMGGKENKEKRFLYLYNRLSDSL